MPLGEWKPLRHLVLEIALAGVLRVAGDREPGRRPVQRVQGKDDEGLKKEAAVSMEEKENSEHMVQ